MKKTKTLGIVLGSGGSRGMAHVGFLQALEEEGIKPNFVSGCSIGAVIGALYTAGKTPEYMHKEILKLAPLDIVQPTLKLSALFGTGRMKQTLKKHLGDIQFSDLKIPFSCVATDLKSKQLVTFNEGSVIDAVVASASIPGLFKPTVINNMVLVDGGVIERLPVNAIKRFNPDVIVVVDVLNGSDRLKNNTSTPNAIKIVIATTDVMDDVITEYKIKEYSKVVDLWVKPNLGSVSPYTFKNLENNYSEGYKSGKEYVKQIKDLLK